MNKKTLFEEFIKKHKYFTLQKITETIPLNKKVIKNYLLEFKKQGVIFNAGYGFYTTLKEEFQIPIISRVETITRLLKKRFPFVNFIIWDTKQLQSLYLHTQVHSITFVETDQEMLSPFYDCISEKYQKTYIEKRNKDYFAQIPLYLNPVVIRKKPSRSPYKGITPTLEKILVDMFIDLNTYRYISEVDYWQIWQELSSHYRINIGKVISYSKRRKRFQSLFSQLIANKTLDEMTFAALLEEVAKVTRKKNGN